MRNTHFTFRKASGDMLEQRLIMHHANQEANNDRPEKTRLKDLTQIEANRNLERWKRVYSTLRDAAALNDDRKAQTLLKDDDLLRMISAMVVVRDDKHVEWLPKTAQVYAEQILKEYLAEPETLEHLREDATKFVTSYVGSLRKSGETIAETSKDYEKISGGSVLPEIAEVQKIFNSIGVVDTELADRQHALIAIAREILRAENIDEDFIVAFSSGVAGRQIPAELNALTSSLKDIAIKYVLKDEDGKKSGAPVSRKDHPKLSAGLQKEMMDAITAAAKLMLVGKESAGDVQKLHKECKATLLKARDDSTSAITALNTQQNAILKNPKDPKDPKNPKYIVARDAYLEWLSGRSLDSALLPSIDPKTGKFDQSLFKKGLEAINPRFVVNDTKLDDALGFKDPTKFSADSTAIDAFVEKMKELGVIIDRSKVANAARRLYKEGREQAGSELGLTDPNQKNIADDALPFLQAVWNRSGLEKFLQEKGMPPSQIQNGLSNIVLSAYLGKENAKLLTESGTTGLQIGTISDLAKIDPNDLFHPGTKNILPDRLINHLFETETKSGKRVVTKGGYLSLVQFLSVNQNVDATAEAQMKWDSLLKAQKIDSKETKFEMDEAALKTELATLSIGADAEKILGEARTREIYKMPLTTQMKEMSLSSLGTLKVGGGLWWAWMRTMPGYYFDGTLNRELLKIDDQRNALKTYRDTLAHVLESVEDDANPMESTIRALQALQTAQDTVKHPQLARGAFQNVDQAYTMLRASGAVIEKLGKEGWDRLPRDARMVALSLVMRAEDQSGMQRAQDFIRDFLASSDPEEGLRYIREKMPDTHQQYKSIQAYKPEVERAKASVSGFVDLPEAEQVQTLFRALTPEDRRGLFLQLYTSNNDLGAVRKDLATFHHLRDQSGESILGVVENRHGVFVLPMALQTLMTTIRNDGAPDTEDPGVASMHIGRWMIDRDGTADQKSGVFKALHTILSGHSGAKDAVIDAFIQRKDMDYVRRDGTSDKVTALEATDIVARVQQSLNWQARQRQVGMEQMSDHDFRTNPIERGVRGALSTLQDLWAGDWVKKSSVIATLVVGLWAIRESWKHAGDKDAPGWMKMLKVATIATPLLIVGNAAVKRSTGKDFLGTWFSYIPKEQRDSALERFRRRAAKDESEFLNSPSGHSALRELTGPDSAVTVDQLLLWRNSIQLSSKQGEIGSNVYSNGAPETLSIGRIHTALGAGATREEAYKIGYLAFEALCVDIAEMRGLRGTRDEKASQGADIIRNEYTGPNAESDIADKSHITMLDVIISESKMPDRIEAIHQDRNFVEWLADSMDWTFDEAKAKLIALSTQAKIDMFRKREIAPELYKSSVDTLKGTSKDIYDWMRATKIKLKEEIPAHMDAAVRIAADALASAGVVMRKVGDMAEWTIEKATDLTNVSLESLQRAYEVLQGVGVTGEPLRLIDSMAYAVSGYTMSEWILYGRSRAANDKAIDLMKTDALFKEELKKFTDGLNLVATVKPESSDWEAKAREALGITNAIKDCTPSERALVLERIKRHVYARLLDARIAAVEAVPAHANAQGLKQALDYPLKGLELGTWNNLLSTERAKEFEKHYGVELLSMLHSEPTQFIGGLRRYIEAHPDGVMRSTLSVGHWIATVPNRDDSLEYLTAIDTFVQENMRSAEDHFKNDTEKVRKLQDYRSMLETILTNGVLDMTLRNEKSLGLPTSALQPSHLAGEPFTLTIAQAKDFRNFLAIKRGAIADPVATAKYVEQFRREDGISQSLHTVQQDARIANTLTGLGAPVAAPAVSGAPDQKNRPKNLNKLTENSNKPNDNTERRQIIDALGSHGLTLDERQRLVARLDAGATAMDPISDANIQEALDLVSGVSAAKAKELETKILVYTNTGKQAAIQKIASLVNGARTSAPHEQGRTQVQHALDRCITQQLDRVVKEIQKVTRAELKGHAQYGQWESQLLDLYRMTHESTDRLSDTIAYALEYLLYQGKRSAPEDGETHFKKFETYLSRHGLKAPGDARYPFGRVLEPFGAHGSRSRMSFKDFDNGPSYIDDVLARNKIIEKDLSK